MQKRKSSNTKNGWIEIHIGDRKSIQSNLLNQYKFTHSFFSKDFGLFAPNQLSKHLTDTCSVHFTKQVHGERIIFTEDAIDSSNICADGMISSNNGQSLWLYTADCIPILFADTKTGCVAAVHAGWKGISKKIINKTISKLNSIGSKPESIIVALGPAISQSNYQISLDTAKLISFSIYSAGTKPDENIKKLESTGILKYDDEPNKFKLDIRLAAKYQLEFSGVLPNNISINQDCTYTNKELFNSWRRDHIKSRQWSFILSKG